MSVKLQINPNNCFFVFGKDAVNLGAELQLVHFDGETPPLALTVKTLSQSVTVFLTETEIEILKIFFTAPELAPGHCSDC